MMRALLALLATAVALASVEVAMRATYDPAWYRQPPFRPGESPRLNRDRLRDVDYGPKAPGTYRVLLLGDSFTFGSGVADDDAIWPALVERRLNAERPLAGVERYEVLNGGLPGSLTDQWVALYAQQRRTFQPDLVLVVFFLRDGTRVDGSMIAQTVAARASAQWPWGVEHWITYRYLQERRAMTGLLGEFVGYFVDAYVGSEPQTEEWRQAQRNLVALQSSARADGARFGLVTFPILFGLDTTPYPFTPVLEEIGRFGDAHAMPVRSLLPAFAGRRAADLWVGVGNQHPNARGHAIAAEAILRFVETLAAP